jgi:hypothetical protein
MWSHIFLAGGAAAAIYKEDFGLAYLVIITTALSLVYHYHIERPSPATALEGFLARILFLVGTSRFLTAAIPGLVGPSAAIIALQFACFLGVILTFIGTNIYKQYYDPFHSVVHVCGGILVMIGVLFS